MEHSMDSAYAVRDRVLAVVAAVLAALDPGSRTADAERTAVEQARVTAVHGNPSPSLADAADAAWRSLRSAAEPDDGDRLPPSAMAAMAAAQSAAALARGHLDEARALADHADKLADAAVKALHAES